MHISIVSANKLLIFVVNIMPKNLVWNNHNKKSDSWPWKEPGFSAEQGFSTVALLKFGVR